MNDRDQTYRFHRLARYRDAHSRRHRHVLLDNLGPDNLTLARDGVKADLDIPRSARREENGVQQRCHKATQLSQPSKPENVSEAGKRAAYTPLCANNPPFNAFASGSKSPTSIIAMFINTTSNPPRASSTNPPKSFSLVTSTFRNLIPSYPCP